MEITLMTNKTYDLAHFHMLLTESMTRLDSEDTEDSVLLDPLNELLDCPHGLVNYITHCCQFHMELLNEQSTIFAKIEPTICQKLNSLSEKLNSLSEKVFELWNASSECDII
jgi:hypothetical protein